jgi:ABC-type taurine transport system substrate-binding protein
MIRATKFGAQGLKADRGTPTELLLSQLLVRLAAGVLAICFLLPLPAHSQVKPEKVRIAYPTISITLAPLWFAKDKGLFEQEGLDVDPTYIRGGTTIVQAVIGGNVQIGYAGVPPILSAMARGAPLVVVAVLNNKMDYLIVSRTPVRQPSELNGKKFAISSFGSSSEFAARLEKVGADPSKGDNGSGRGFAGPHRRVKDGCRRRDHPFGDGFCGNVRARVSYAC